MIRGLITLLAVVLTSATVAQQATPAEDLLQGFSQQRLQRIEEQMRQAVDEGITVGGQGLIARDGEVIYHQTWGHADREAQAETQPDTLYRIYSMTKPITSVALLMLYEEGHFLLSDPIDKFLPEFANAQVLVEDAEGGDSLRPAARPPTVRDLLRHTAGLSYGVFGNSAVDRLYMDVGLFEKTTLADFSETLGGLPLLLDPGTRWHYSLAVDVQGRLIEVISGKSLGEFFRERIFQPLSMNDTFFHVPEEKRRRLAQLYTPRGGSALWSSRWTFGEANTLDVADPELSRPYFEDGFIESGGAGLVSSADDYLRFALMLAGEGEVEGVRLLAPGTVRLLHRDHLGPIDSSGLRGMDGFGLGVGIVNDPASKSGELGARGAYGWGGAAGTNFWVDPERNIVGIYMNQSIPHQTTLSQRFKVLTYQALME